MTDELDDLLQPTVGRQPARTGPLPWRVASQFWVAFFGGVPAVTAIAFLNARRLGATVRKQRWILVAGLIAASAYLGLVSFVGTEASARSTLRIAGRVVAVLLFLVVARIQREDDGRYQVFGSGEYASLWGPGILASVLGGLLLVGGAMLVMMVLE